MVSFQPSADLSSSYLLTWASLVAQTVKRLSTICKTRVWSLGQEEPLEKEMATDSSILAWKIPWTEDPGRLQSMGSQRVRHNWATSLSLYLLTQHLYWASSLLSILLFIWYTFSSLPQAVMPSMNLFTDWFSSFPGGCLNSRTSFPVQVLIPNPFFQLRHSRNSWWGSLSKALIASVSNQTL